MDNLHYSEDSSKMNKVFVFLLHLIMLQPNG